MDVKSFCMECKYFKKGSNRLGKCELSGRSMWPDESCQNWTAGVAETKVSNSNENTTSYKELTERIEALETQVKLIMKAM